MPIFFSIIIPTYNRATLITETINSLLKQSFQNFELLVIDDGSTDNTEEVVASIKDERISYCKKGNEERGAARNYGTRLARGKYINFFDSDDLAYSNHLQVAFNLITSKHPHCEVLHTNYDVKKGDKVEHSEKKIKEGIINEFLIRDNFLSCNNVFVRQDIALEHPFPENRIMAIAEDWALWLTLGARYPIYHSDIVTSTIVFHDNRSVFDFNIDKIIKRDLLLIKYLFEDKAFVSYYKKGGSLFKAERYTFIALFLAIKGRKKESVQYLILSIKATIKVFFTRRFWGTIKNLI